MKIVIDKLDQERTNVTVNELETIVSLIKDGFTCGEIEGDNGERVVWDIYEGEINYD